MKIGTLTIHHVTNFGAVWQAYALSRYLASLGHEVEIIDYRPAVAVTHYFQGFRFSLRPNFIRALQYRSFHRFIRRLPLGSPVSETTAQLAEASQRYEAIVAGSDQIWCTGEGSFRGYDSNFFLDFCRSSGLRKISYAASAGNTKDFGAQTQAIGESLRGFHSLSVRDDPTASLVEAAAGRRPAVVLDPVFLHDFREVVGDVPDSKDLVIFAEKPHRFDALAVELARRHGLRIVSLGVPSHVATTHLRVVSPVEWLRRIKGSRIVLTDFFHGTAVSLQFGRPVAVAAPPGKTSKITDLLRRVNLMELYLGADQTTSTSLVSLLGDAKSFAQEIESRLRNPRERSFAFLNQALRESPPGDLVPVSR